MAGGSLKIFLQNILLIIKININFFYLLLQFCKISLVCYFDFSWTFQWPFCNLHLIIMHKKAQRTLTRNRIQLLLWRFPFLLLVVNLIDVNPSVLGKWSIASIFLAFFLSNLLLLQKSFELSLVLKMRLVVLHQGKFGIVRQELVGTAILTKSINYRTHGWIDHLKLDGYLFDVHLMSVVQM